MSLNFKTDADATVATVYLNFKHLQSNGDATSNYAVEFSKGLTTRKLVDIVLRHSPDEWGYVELKDPYKRSEILEYKCGKIVSIDNALFEKVADIEIATITASGGYSRMDYVVDLPAAIIDEAHADAETDDDQPPAERAADSDTDKSKPDGLSTVAKIAFAMQKASAHLLSHKNIMVAVSGGSDSDVMLDMLLRVVDREKLTFVFFDTGIEYAATKRHLDDLEKKYNIKIDRQPAANPVPLGCKQYGQPFLSKYASEMIERLQKYDFDFASDGNKGFAELLEKYPHCKAALKWWCNAYVNENGKKSSFNINRFFGLKEFMIANPPQFKISNKCCRGAKKKTSEKYEKSHTFDCKCLGLRKAEGGIRAASIKSCFTRSTKGADISRPIFWFDDAAKKRIHRAIRRCVLRLLHRLRYDGDGLRGLSVRQ